MPAIEIGRICVKVRGREAGKKCVIVDIIDDNFVLVTGPKDVSGIKRRRVNILHLEPTDKKIEIQKGASDDEVKKKLQESNLLDYVKEKVKLSIPTL
ncbi:50S ribosomal protein L14e [Sulfolobus sp. A20]|uniref:50S ribosomal protein L14e n=1 Tax=Sulfolobaceae TaxID=118883 RepID=UPI000845D1F8|nr:MULTISPECIES: 50S ribosomal protein L14e [unclassified Sulfolobus]TRM73790.1 50S ribosomal protein L14e [Sulfolobus sp. E5]TRM77611.1 50S ribosomal protein L14e [Sulfolobus sp. A20-N-F8]TRM81872.1 50S ribosomal protein L14e [Sulfolobus sp. D5]TRM83355.1 50S ribosomal protein L14e [Sulfolobus sp. A20-N-F6]TRM85096.1 50S ribosomal protein L14e [Sulfolobus sp. F3]TRM89914.1 50S ribosomal protein L14e [Sulfolobus sp. C3]TRM93453.1 50S ribosomal protein L14e [Sulfolobus sp. A20-N-G8]TRN01540.